MNILKKAKKNYFHIIVRDFFLGHRNKVFYSNNKNMDLYFIVN